MSHATLAKPAILRNVSAQRPNPAEVIPFASSLDHILAEIGRVELLVRAQVAKARQVSAGADEYKGLVISEQEVADLLRRTPGSPPFADAPTGSDSNEHLDAIRKLG